MVFIFHIFIFIFGLAIGSFLNCVIYRLEQDQSFLKGRSYCPQCKCVLRWTDLIPVISFLLLGGKCRYCKSHISLQYPLIEMATGFLFLLIFGHQSSIFNLDLVFLFYITSVFIVIFVYDLKHYLIPDSILFPAIGITFAYRLWNIAFLGNYILAIGLAAGFFLFIFLVSNGNWMGFGDVKLVILLGLLLGFPGILTGLFLAFAMGAIVGVISMLIYKRGLKSEIPFAPFLIGGTGIAFFWGPALINCYRYVFFF